MSHRKLFLRGFFPLLHYFSKRSALSICLFNSKIINELVPCRSAKCVRRGPSKGTFMWALNSFNVQFSSRSDDKCWNCHQDLKPKNFSCSSCGALQRPNENVNYFKLFGVSETFDVNLDDLTAKYRNMQMAFHPDKFANKSEKELEISEMYSRLLNKAYATLKEPVKRGFYLLDLRKFSAEESFPIEQAFLASIMEKNEQLEAITSDSALAKFISVNNEQIATHINLVSASFSTSNWKEARLNLMKLNYFLNLDLKLKGKQTNLNSHQQR